MTKFKKVVFGFLGVCLFAMMSLAQAQNAPDLQESPQKGHTEQRIQEIYSQLNLTDEQKAQLEANKQQNRAKMTSIRQALKANKEALKEALMDPRLDMAKITTIHDQIKGLLSQEEDNKLNSILAVRTILTPEQFSQFINLMQTHKHRQAQRE